MSSIKEIASVTILSLSSLGHFTSARATEPDVQSVLDSVDAAVAEALEAANNVTDEEIERAQELRVAEIEASMRLIENDASLGESLPLPSLIGSAELSASLANGEAWLNGIVREEKIEPLINIAYSTGPLLFYEKVCRTGNEVRVANDLFEALDEYLTPYPQRLIMKHVLDDRDLFAHGNTLQCSAMTLERWRNRQADTLERLEP